MTTLGTGTAFPVLSKVHRASSGSQSVPRLDQLEDGDKSPGPEAGAIFPIHVAGTQHTSYRSQASMTHKEVRRHFGSGGLTSFIRRCRWMAYSLLICSQRLDFGGDVNTQWLRETMVQWLEHQRRLSRDVQSWLLYCIRSLENAYITAGNQETPWWSHLSWTLREWTIGVYQKEWPWWCWAVRETYYRAFPFQLKEHVVAHDEDGKYWEKQEDPSKALFRKHNARFMPKDESVDSGRLRFFPASYKSEAVRLTRTPNGQEVGVNGLRELARLGVETRLEQLKTQDSELAPPVSSPHGFVIEEAAPSKPSEAIKYYTEQLRTFNPMTFPEEWAFIQFALAECFVKCSEGTDLGCLDNAIYHLQNCSQVYSADFEPCLYAVACQSLGRVMLHRIRLLATSDTLEARARLGTYQYLALETLEQGQKAVPAAAYPLEHACIKVDLAKALLGKRDGDEVDGPEKAIPHLQEALVLLEASAGESRMGAGRPGGRKPAAGGRRRSPILVDASDPTQYPRGVTKAAILGLLGDAYLACRAANRSTCLRKAVLQYRKSLELTPATTPDMVIAHLRLARAYSAEHTMGNKPNGLENPLSLALQQLEIAARICQQQTASAGDLLAEAYQGHLVECQWQMGRLHLRKYKEELSYVRNKSASASAALMGGGAFTLASVSHLSEAIRLLEVVILHTTTETPPAPDRYCAVHQELWEAYMLHASAEGAGAGSLSVAMDHVRAVASQYNKDTSPRDWLLTASMLAETSACMGRWEESLAYQRAVFDAIGVLVNSVRFDVFDASQGMTNQAKAQGTSAPTVYAQSRPVLTKAMDTLLMCVFQEKPWPRRLQGPDKVLLVDHETGTDDTADEPDSQLGSQRTQAKGPSLGARALRCLCCWSPSYPALVGHPLAVEGLAMLCRLGHVRLVENAAHWQLDKGLRARQLLEVLLPPQVLTQTLLPLHSKLASLLWLLNQDVFAPRHWDLFRLSPPVQDEASWAWATDPVPSQHKLVQRLSQLEQITYSLLAQYDPLYPLLSMVPSRFPLSAKPLVDAKGRDVTNPMKARVASKGRQGGEAQLEQARAALQGAGSDSLEGEDARTSPPSDAQDEVDVILHFLQSQLGSKKEALIAWEHTPSALLTFVVYKAAPPPDGSGPRYEKRRLGHVSTCVKLLAGPVCVTELSGAVQSYLNALHEDPTHDMAPALQAAAQAIRLSHVLSLLPAHVSVLTLVPCALLDVLPLHLLPMSSLDSPAQGPSPTLAHKYETRYASSLMTLRLSHLQSEHAKAHTPWFFSQLCLLEEPEVASNGLSKGPKQGGSLECRLVELSYSATRSHVDTLAGSLAYARNVRTVFQHYDLAPDDAKAPPAEGTQGGPGEGGQGLSSEQPSRRPPKRANPKGTAPTSAGPASKQSSLSWSEVLSQCRACHLVCPMAHFPTQGLLLAPDPLEGDCLMTARHVVRQLHLRHCGLVTLSRAGVCDSIFSVVKHLLPSSAGAAAFQPFELADAFMCAGALSVVQPLWTCSGDGGLASSLLMWRLYSCLVDVASTDRPVAAALRQAQDWLQHATCKHVLDELAQKQRRIPEDLRVSIEKALWAFVMSTHKDPPMANTSAGARKGPKSNGPVLHASTFSQRPDLLDTQPFAAPYYWAGYRAIGACRGVHRAALGDVSDDEEDQDEPERGPAGADSRLQWEDYDMKKGPGGRGAATRRASAATGPRRMAHGLEEEEEDLEEEAKAEQQRANMRVREMHKVLAMAPGADSLDPSTTNSTMPMGQAARKPFQGRLPPVRAPPAQGDKSETSASATVTQKRSSLTSDRRGSAQKHSKISPISGSQSLQRGAPSG